MKRVWQKATEQVCGWTNGPPRHSETWWWNDEVAKAIDAIRYGIKPKQQVIRISIKRKCSPYVNRCSNQVKILT